MGFGAFSASAMLAGGVAPAAAVATVNLAKVGSGLASAISNWRFGNVRRQWVAPLTLAGVAGGVGGALLLTSGVGETAGRWMPWILLVMGLLVLRRFLAPGSDWPTPRISGGATQVMKGARGRVIHRFGLPQGLKERAAGAQLPAIGFLAGLVNSLSGAYGPVATSALILTRRTRPRYIVGTVNFVEFAVAGAVSATILVRTGAGETGWQLPLALMTGAAVLAPFGAYLARRAPPRAVGVAVGAMMVGLNLLAIVKSLYAG
jgi:hypothetical protein